MSEDKKTYDQTTMTFAEFREEYYAFWARVRQDREDREGK